MKEDVQETIGVLNKISELAYNHNPKEKVCVKCGGKGWYYVNEWIGTLQGRKDCNCTFKQ